MTSYEPTVSGDFSRILAQDVRKGLQARGCTDAEALSVVQAIHEQSQAIWDTIDEDDLSNGLLKFQVYPSTRRRDRVHSVIIQPSYAKYLGRGTPSNSAESERIDFCAPRDLARLAVHLSSDGGERIAHVTLLPPVISSANTEALETRLYEDLQHAFLEDKTLGKDRDAVIRALQARCQQVCIQIGSYCVDATTCTFRMDVTRTSSNPTCYDVKITANHWDKLSSKRSDLPRTPTVQLRSKGDVFDSPSDNEFFKAVREQKATMSPFDPNSSDSETGARASTEGEADQL